jgi:hypothetical protein
MKHRVPGAAALSIALSCVLPLAAHAQLLPLQDDPSWGPRLRVTPYVGYMPAITRNETWIHNNGTMNTFLDVDYRLGEGFAAGVNGEVTVHGPWNALVGVMFATRDDNEFFITDSTQTFQINGSRYLFARAGASFRLKERESEMVFRRLSASVYAAPFYMREMPRAQTGFEDDAVFDASNHFGLSGGIAAELPFARDRLSVQVAVEDFATLWSSDALARLADSFFNDATVGSATRVDSDISSQWLVRAGLSFRWP